MTLRDRVHRLLRRALRRRPGPLEVRDERVRAGEVRRDDRRARGPALRDGAGDRLLDRRAHRAPRAPLRRRCSRSTSPRPRSTAPVSAIPDVDVRAPRGARGVSPTAPIDLIVCSEVLYYLDSAFDVRRDAIERTLTRHAARRPLAAADAALPVQRRRGPRAADGTVRHARLLAARPTSTCSTGWIDAAADRRRRSRRARHRPRLPRGGRGRRRHHPHARADRSRTTRPPLSKEFLRGELDDARTADRGRRRGTRTTASRCGSAAEAETLDPRARTVRSAPARRCATTRACSPPAPSRRRCPSRARPRSGCCCCAASPRRACCATAPREAKTAVVIGTGLHRLRGRRVAGHARAAGDARSATRRSRTPPRLGEEAGRRIQGWLEELGIELVLGAGVEAFGEHGVHVPGATRSPPT